MNYINGKQENGLKYDYKKIRKKYKELECPAEYYNPCTSPIEKASWIVEVSQRATGKTTAWLLWGLVMFQLYGTVTHYVRGTENEIMPKVSKDMYSVIVNCGYIEKITDGEYNNIEYKSRKWTLVHVDEETGEVDRRHPNYCTYMCSVDKAGNLKSSHNSPTGDLIIYDEFIPVNYKFRCDFVPFCDLCKTVFRDRLSGKIVMLANTIDKEHQYFHELEIYDRISEMNIGENAFHTTDGGTNIYVEIVGTPVVLKARKKAFNKLFLSFRNPALSAITGDSTWAIRNYPHIPDIEYEVLYNKIYISHNNKYLRLEFVENEYGVCIYAHWATKIYDDSKILVCRSIESAKEFYGIGEGNVIGDLIEWTAKRRRLYFASNDCGVFFQNYLNQCQIKLPLM